jgi:hypothetical protein
MTLYRVRHIPSGLFYRACREASIKFGSHQRYVKSNLTKNPKIYHSKPSIGMLSGTFYNHLVTQQLLDQWAAKNPNGSFYDSPYKRDKLHPFLSSEWMVETMDGGEWRELGNLA